MPACRVKMTIMAPQPPQGCPCRWAIKTLNWGGDTCWEWLLVDIHPGCPQHSRLSFIYALDDGS
jgi:hypothetical protein